MKKYEIENNIIICLIDNPELITQMYVDMECFENYYNKKILQIIREMYEEYKRFDITLFKSKLNPNEVIYFGEYIDSLMNLMPNISLFNEYQNQLIENYKEKLIKEEINNYISKKISEDELIEKIQEINNKLLVNQDKRKVTPDEMLAMVRNKDKIIEFARFKQLNEKLRIKKKTVNIIAARPSEGKSALALNLFCDLAKKYKCIYFNMEMTEEEVYERMLAIEGNVTMAEVNTPKTEFQDKFIHGVAEEIYNFDYEVINGSKTVNAIKNKIIKEQRDGHVIVFIDYVGYIVGKNGENDRDRIGNAVRELNNITKDYDCTIFLIAQINRNGSDVPTMQDLKDSGELEQTADTIILIHDKDKEDNSDVKEIGFLIPKCRGGKRNVRISVTFEKKKQRMTTN